MMRGLDATQTVEAVRRGAEACERAMGMTTERDLVKALVASMPGCVWCEGGDVFSPGTKGVPTDPLCDACAATWVGDLTQSPQDLPYAPALRALLERMKAWDAPIPGAGEALLADDGEQG